MQKIQKKIAIGFLLQPVLFLIRKSLSCQGIFEIQKLKIALLGNDFNYSIVFYVEEMSMMLLLPQHKTLVAGKLLGFFLLPTVKMFWSH